MSLKALWVKLIPLVLSNIPLPITPAMPWWCLKIDPINLHLLWLTLFKLCMFTFDYHLLLSKIPLKLEWVEWAALSTDCLLPLDTKRRPILLAPHCLLDADAEFFLGTSWAVYSQDACMVSQIRQRSADSRKSPIIAFLMANDSVEPLWGKVGSVRPPSQSLSSSQKPSSFSPPMFTTLLHPLLPLLLPINPNCSTSPNCVFMMRNGSVASSDTCRGIR